MPRRFTIDPAHRQVSIWDQPLVHDVWESKYKYHLDSTPEDTIKRVAEAICPGDEDTLLAMRNLLWVPGGRIWGGAGTTKIVTLQNCYVSQRIGDSMEGIADALKEAMLTLQQGGGIGMDFSTLRPASARLERTGSDASGPLPFMDMWDSMCGTIKSAGDRRGAMMAVLHCEHPDLPKFIQAKHVSGRLTNFNVSVLVTDAFMSAVEHDEDWFLGFSEPRLDGQHITVVEHDDGTLWYVYSVWKARDLWDMILKSTYETSEPGVIFIDRVNDWNNMNYEEGICATNPCGEQPLPPWGSCNLGAVNLARMVKNPFSVEGEAQFDLSLLKKVVDIGVRFLDNVIDVTHYPVMMQEAEQQAKRRTGLGITGLGNALAFMGMHYGSAEARQLTRTIMYTICVAAYESSHKLALERGPFPRFNPREWGKTSPIVKHLPSRLRASIKKGGIRNAVLLTIAPTGTTSILVGNVSGGVEPVFAHEAKRKVLQKDDSHKEYIAYDYGALVYRALHPDATQYPPYMVETADLSVEQHVKMQAVCQEHIDASISKTINCPKEMPYEDFREVYSQAYQLGCKGCTTYRPSDVRGSVLELLSQDPAQAQTQGVDKTPPEVLPRPEILEGKTYKLKWQDVAYYVTINQDPATGRPHEMFISSTSSKYSDWSTALSLMISANMRRGDDIRHIPEELKKVVSAFESGYYNQKFYGSLVALIGETIERHLDNTPTPVDLRLSSEVELLSGTQAVTVTVAPDGTEGSICDHCGFPSVVASEGCRKCQNCNYSTCG